LGGEVHFAYCEHESGDLPCPRMLMCWESFLPVERYLRLKLTPEQWDRCFNQEPKSKVESLVELIEAAKQRQKQPD
jgi:hypothetical protein